MKSNGALAGFLFGSYAKGTVGPMSDIDIAVIFPLETDFKCQDIAVNNIRYKIEKEFKIKHADVINIAKSESSLLRYNILIAESQLLFSDNSQLVSYFTMKALHDFEDTRRIRKMRAIVLEKFFVTN